MISIQQAAEIIRSQTIKRSVTVRPLSECSGFYLAEEITSPFDLPSFDNSAMDGYAVCGISDRYDIVGEIPAGDTSDHSLEPGKAVRIFTGAKVPNRTTAVVMQEKSRVNGSVLHIEETVNEGQNIRQKGYELAEGDSVFKSGYFISPASIGLIGSLGLDKVKVFNKPNVRVISTGNELIQPGEKKREGEIYESNSFALQSALARFGFNCQEKTHIRDNFSAIKTGIADYLEQSDILLISGGISVGDYDFVKQALEENGVEELFYKVRQKPGKPLYFGRRENTFVFALPGNPASSLTCFYVHVLPLLQLFSGAKTTGLQHIEIPLNHDYDNRSDRPIFLKALVDHQTVSILNRQSSSMIHSMATGNALVFFDGQTKLRKGERVETILI
jgi:molybdopterin molybdotransferase